MGMLKEIRDLKCPQHEYLRDEFYFIYEVSYASCKPLPNTLCRRCGMSMSLHEIQKK